MRKLLALCFVLFISAIAVGPAAASKITTDPNVPGSTVADPTDRTAADERLSQKITYQSGYARLHAAADDLTRITGVTIRAGSSSKDWQIRDIPLVICAKDLPLGKLLSAIAESTHTLLSSQTLDTGEKVYRFYRNKRAQDAIDNALKAAQQKQYEQIDWAWDAMLKLAKSPEAQAELGKTVPDGSRGLIAAAKLLDSLGPDARGRVFSGEEITADGKNPSQAAIIEEIFLSRWESLSEDVDKQTPLERPSPEDIASARFAIKMNDGGDSGHTDVWIETPMSFGTTRYPYTFLLTNGAPKLEKLRTLHLASRPKGEEIADQESDRPADLKLRPLVTDQDWEQPLLATKIKLESPKDKTCITFAHAVAALAEASGLNIVTEDFLSHNWGYKGEYDGFFGSETIPSSLLKKTLGSWFYNADDKLVVGWVWSHGLWRKAHRNIVAESLLLSLTSKLDAGVELDDATPVVSLTPEQRNDWIYNNRAMLWLMRAFWRDRPLWQFYDSLSPDDKALAKSDDGLPLAKLDPARTIGSLKEKLALEQAQVLLLPTPKKPNEQADAQGSIDSLLDPAVFRTAVMRIKRVPATVQCCGDSGLTGHIVWYQQLHHSYVMEIEYEKDGQKATLRTSDLGLSLPVYSSKRETELAKKLDKSASP